MWKLGGWCERRIVREGRVFTAEVHSVFCVTGLVACVPCRTCRCKSVWMAFTASSVTVPTDTVDSANVNNPYGSKKIRKLHMNKILQDEYELHDVLPLTAVNPGLDRRVDALLQQHHEAEAVDTLAVDEGAQETLQLLNDLHLGEFADTPAPPDGTAAASLRRVLKPAFATELWLALSVRAIKQTVIPFICILLSLLALQSGMSEEMWTTLQFMMLITSKAWITAFALDVATELRERLLSDPDISSNVRLVVGDNCAYQTRTVHEHTDHSGEYIQSINWATVPLRKSKLPQLSDSLPHGGWRRDDASPFDVRSGFDPNDADMCNLKDDAWSGFMEQAAEEEARLREDSAARRSHDILRHPDVEQPEKTEIFYEPPVFTEHGTAAYDDINTWLDVVATVWVFLVGIARKALGRRHLKAASVILVVGDHQTWSRMLFLKLRRPVHYAWMIMMPGEFHFLYHVLMALHRLWWFAIGRYVVAALNCHKTIGQEWTSIEKCKYYDHFYQLVIVTLCAYLVEIVPPALLLQPARLLRAVQGNKAAARVITFLYHFGLPWLALRQAIRSNKASTINVMWRLAYHWFSVTNKNNYRIMSVIVTVVTYLLVPELAVIWTVMRTASLSGYPGRNVPWDFCIERQNRTCKQALGTAATRERIINFLPVINAFRHIWPRFRRSMGRGDGEASDYSHVTQADFDVLMDFWRRTLGSTFAELCAERDGYAFDGDDDDGDSGRGGGGSGAGPSRRGTRSGKKSLNEKLLGDDDSGPADPWQITLDHALEDGHVEVDKDDETEYAINKIERVRGEGTKREYYVSWRGFLEKTWERRKVLLDTSALDVFERKQQSKRKRSAASSDSASDDGGGSGGGDGGSESGSGSGSVDEDTGDDPDERYDRKITRWYRDVTTLILKQTPS